MPICKSTEMMSSQDEYVVYINYTDVNGMDKQLSRIAYGMDKAKSIEQQLILESKQIQQAIGEITLSQLYDEYIKVKQIELRKSTVEKTSAIYRCHINPFLSNVYLNDLSVKVLQNWKLSINPDLSSRMKQNIFSALRTILNYAVLMEYIPAHALKKVGNFRADFLDVKNIDYYTKEEFKSFIAAAKKQAVEFEATKDSTFEWNYYVFFNIAFYAGLRKGEIHALKWSDINEKYLSVSKSISQKLKGNDVETPPKNRSSIRTLQIPIPLMNILADHKERLIKEKKYASNKRILGEERCLRDSTIENKNKLYAALSENKKIRIHDFRHTHASLLVNARINIQEVARRLGHSKIEITWNIYSHLYPREEELAVEILNEISI